jgi:hypothetical protein
MDFDFERMAFGSTVGVTGATVAAGTGRERDQQVNLSKEFDEISQPNMCIFSGNHGCGAVVAPVLPPAKAMRRPNYLPPLERIRTPDRLPWAGWISESRALSVNRMKSSTVLQAIM